MDETTPPSADAGADVSAVGPVAEHVRTPWSEFWRKFRKQHVALGAGGFVLILVVLAILAPMIVPFDAENFFDYDTLNSPPSAKHWFGVDPLGRDIFSRLLVDAVDMRDYPVIQALVLLFSLKFILINLIVDVLYGLVNPTIRFR